MPSYLLLVGSKPHKYSVTAQILSQSPVLRMLVDNNDETYTIDLPEKRNADFVNLIEYLTAMVFSPRH